MGVLGETAVKIRADTSGFHSEASAGVLGSVTKIAVAAAGIFGGIQLGKGLFNSTIKSAADFQTTLKVLQAVTGTTDQGLSRLSKTAIKLGADAHLPAVSASQAADAMLQLGKAGFSTNQIIAASHGVLLLATAAEVDNATAADMVTKAIGAFGLQAKDANHVVNDFAGAANASQSSLQDVGDAVTQAGAGFHALRIPIDDAATAIAEMAKQGITGGMAGAALNVAFTRLATPTTAASKIMKDMGVNLFDNNQKFVGLRAAIEQMSPKLADMTDKQRLHTLSVLGGTRGMKALADVLGVSLTEWDKTHAAVTRAGQAQQIANAKTSGFNGAVLALKNTLGTMALNIGIAVIPKVTELVKWLSRIIAAPNMEVRIKIIWQGIVGLAGDIREAISRALFGGTKQVIAKGSLRVGQEAIVVDPGLVDTFPAMIKKALFGTGSKTEFLEGQLRIGQKSIVVDDGLFGALQAKLVSMPWATIGATIATGISATVNISVEALNRISETLLAWAAGPGGTAAAEAGLVIGLKMLSSLMDPSFWVAHWQLIGGVALSAASIMFPEGKLAEIGVKAIGFLLKPFELLGVRLATLGGDAVVAFAAKVESSLGGLAGRIVLGIGQAIGTATTTVVGLFVDLGAKMITGFINKIAGLGIIFRTAAFTAIVTVIGNLIGAAVGAAERLAVGVANAIKSIPGKLGLKELLLGAILGPIGVVASLASAAAMNIAEKIAGAIKTVAAKLTGLAGDLLGKIRGALSEVLPNAVASATSLAVSIGAAIKNGAINGITGLADLIKNFVEKEIRAGLKKVSPFSPIEVGAAALLGNPIMVGTAMGITQGGPAVAGALKGALSGAFDGATGWLESKSPSQRAARLLGKPIMDGLALGFVMAEPAATQSIVNSLKASLAKISADAAAATEKTAPAVAKAFEHWATQAKGAFDKEMQGLGAQLSAQLTKAKASIDAWKAHLTPAEVRLNTQKAMEQLQSLQGAMDAAWASLSALPQQQADQMADLLAQQKKTLDDMRAAQTGTTTDRDIALHEFQKGVAGSQNDPLALQLVQADQNLRTLKALYNTGAASLADLLAAQDAFDAASAAAADDANAQKLDAAYTTWADLAVAAETGAQAIYAQQVADEAARVALTAQQAAERVTALGVYTAAEGAVWDAHLEAEATSSRTARDKEAASLNTDLNARYARIKQNLDNVKGLWDKHYDDLKGMATTSGKTIVSDLADALDAASDPGQPLEKSLKKVAGLIQKYLKTSSPSELGPLSDLDTWWKSLAPTLVASLDTSMVKGALSDAVTPAGGGFGPVTPAGPGGQQAAKWDNADVVKRLDELIEAVKGGKTPAAVTPISIINKGGVESAVYGARR